MRKALLLIISILTVFALFSCKSVENENRSDDETLKEDETQNEGVSGVLYAPGTSLNIVYGDVALYDYAFEIFSAVGANMTTVPKIASDSSEVCDHEIVVGRTDRRISADAYEKLAKLESENEYEIPYLVYSDENSVAIAFTEDENGYNVTLISAVEAFVRYIGSKESIELSGGNLLYGFVDPLVYQEALDEELIAKQWDDLAKAVEKKLETAEGPFRNESGEEISREEYCDLVVVLLKNMYSLYTDDVISWFANLYEPNGGGYYFSNSARNTVGYLPDIESTSQALNFWAGSGMADAVGGTYAEAIPEWMKEQIVYFVKKLQDPNGYFYHPQWGKELLDNKPARRNRDLEWAGGILKALDANPTYDTPSGIEGDGILYDGTAVVLPSAARLTGRLLSSKVSAVSKIVATESRGTAVSDNLKTKEAFAAYLEQIDIRNNCYGGGNELGTYASQIIARDNQLKAQNADWSPRDMVIEYLNENCYSTTGHWSAVADYNGTNGLLKISGLYNSLGAEMPYPLEAAQSAIASTTTNERAQTICYVYNAWFSVTNIIKNLTLYSSRTDGEDLAKEISAKLLADCAAGLAASAEKTATFKRADGSFSYLTTGSSTNAQGMPVAVPNSLEGDVNATEIGIVGTWGHIFGALGLSGNKISLYTESDRQRYIRILESLDPVIKDPESNDVDVMDFEDDDLGYSPAYAELDFRSSGNATVIKDPNNSKNKVLRFASQNNGGDVMTVACDSLRLNASCFVLEFDMVVNSATNGNFLQVSLGNRCYMLMFSNDSSGVHISDISSGSSPRLSNDFGVTVGFEEWHRYKIEYYVGNESSIRIMVYVDDELVGVTDNYYDAIGARLNGKEGNPVASYTEASFLALSYVNTDIYLDNIKSYKTNSIYTAIIDPEKQPNINIDAPVGDVTDAPGEGEYFTDPDYAEYANKFTYDFMGYPSPSITGSAYGKMVSQYGVLNFVRTAPAGIGETYIQYRLSSPEDISSYNNICSVYEFDFRVSEADLSYDNTPFRLDGSDYIRFVKNSDGKTWSLVKKDTAEIECGEWCNIRFEIYYLNESSEIVKIFVNGEYATELSLGEVAPFNCRLIMYMKSRVETGTTINVDNMIMIHLDKEYVCEEQSGGEIPEEPEIPASSGTGVFYNGEYTGSVRKYNFISVSSSAALNSSHATVESVCGAGKYQLNSSNETFIRLENQNLPSLTDFITVSEFDMYFTGYDSENINGYPYYFMPIRIYDADGNNEYIRFVKNSDGTLSLEKAEAVKICADEWFNVRLEFVYGESVELDIYINGTYVMTKALSSVKGVCTKTWITLNSRIYNGTLGAEQGAVYLDNMFFGHIEAVPTLERDFAGGGDEPDQGDSPDTDESSFTLGSGVYYNSTSTARAYKSWNFNTTGTLNGFSGSSFATGSYVDGAAVLERTASDWSTAYFYYNIAESEFSGNTAGATCKVFEFDYKISNIITSDGRSAFRLDGADYVKFYINSDAQTLSLGAKDAMTINPGEWCNIRFEFYNVSGAKYMQIYVNNEYAYTQALADTSHTFNDRIYFYLESATSVGTTVSVDNLVMAYVDKEYVERQ